MTALLKRISLCLFLAFFLEVLVICITEGEAILAPQVDTEIKEGAEIFRPFFLRSDHIFFNMFLRDAWIYGLAGLLGGLILNVKQTDEAAGERTEKAEAGQANDSAGKV